MIRKGLKSKKLATLEQWILYGKKMRLFIVFLDQKVLDLTDFLDSHPGGFKAIQPYRHKNISKILYQVYPHAPHTKSLLMFYYIGQLCPPNANQQKFLDLTIANSPLKKKQQHKSSILKIRNMSQIRTNEEQKKQVGFSSQHNKVYNLQKQNSQDLHKQEAEQLSINSLSKAYQQQQIKSQQQEPLNELNSQGQHNKHKHILRFETNFHRK